MKDTKNKIWINITLLLLIIVGLIVGINLLQQFGLFTFSGYQSTLFSIIIYVGWFGIVSYFILKMKSGNNWVQIGFRKKKLYLSIVLGFLGSSGFLIGSIIFLRIPSQNLIDIVLL